MSSQYQKAQLYKSLFLEPGPVGYEVEPNKTVVYLLKEEQVKEIAEGMKGVAVIIEHTELDSKNVKHLKIGSVTNTYRDAESSRWWIEYSIDGEHVAEASKYDAVSCYYKSIDKQEAGNYSGLQYDAIIDKITEVNHLALTNNPRYTFSSVVKANSNVSNGGLKIINFKHNLMEKQELTPEEKPNSGNYDNLDSKGAGEDKDKGKDKDKKKKSKDKDSKTDDKDNSDENKDNASDENKDNKKDKENDMLEFTAKMDSLSKSMEAMNTHMASLVEKMNTHMASLVEKMNAMQESGEKANSVTKSFTEELLKEIDSKLESFSKENEQQLNTKLESFSKENEQQLNTKMNSLGDALMKVQGSYRGDVTASGIVKTDGEIIKGLN